MEDEVICGTCDLCGDEADGNVSECNALSCTFVQCGLSTEKGILYHQACLDKFLRKEKLDKSRKTGFKCPRGCGKGSKYPSECPGRVSDNIEAIEAQIDEAEPHALHATRRLTRATRYSLAMRQRRTR